MVPAEQAGTGQPFADHGERAVALFLVIGLTFLLAAPPMLQGERSVEVCAELSDKVELEPQWSMLPIPHWTCTGDQLDPAHLGWWV